MTVDGERRRGTVEPRPYDYAAEAGDLGPGDPPGPLDPLQAELLAAAGAIILLISLLFLKWFGLVGTVGRFTPRAAANGSEGAWHALPVLRWPALVAIAVALLPLLVRPLERWLGLPRRTNAAVAALGAVTALALSYRVLVDLPEPNRVVDQKAGAILGLVGAFLIALGGLESMRAHAADARARRVQTRSRRARVPPGRIARLGV